MDSLLSAMELKRAAPLPFSVNSIEKKRIFSDTIPVYDENTPPQSAFSPNKVFIQEHGPSAGALDFTAPVVSVGAEGEQTTSTDNIETRTKSKAQPSAAVGSAVKGKDTDYYSEGCEEYSDEVDGKRKFKGFVKRLWTLEEDIELKRLVEEHGAKKWSLVAKHLPNRIGKQCRERWHNHLSGEVHKAPWTKEEDEVIFSQHEKFGNTWAKISELLPGRTDNAIKNRYYSTIRRLKRKAARASKDAPDNYMLVQETNPALIFNPTAVGNLRLPGMWSAEAPVPLPPPTSQLFTTTATDGAAGPDIFTDSMAPPNGAIVATGPAYSSVILSGAISSLATNETPTYALDLPSVQAALTANVISSDLLQNNDCVMSLLTLISASNGNESGPGSAPIHNN